VQTRELVQVDSRGFNAVDPAPEGPSLDTAVDWLVDCGESVTRIEDYSEWLRRFEIGLRSAPEHVASFTALPLVPRQRRFMSAHARCLPQTTDRPDLRTTAD
jgi:thioester reductase-like protein